MTKNEALYISAFLDELSDRYGNDGCNDLYLVDTLENRRLLIDACQAVADPINEDDVYVYKGRIGTNNVIIVEYLKFKFMEEYGITKDELDEFKESQQ